MNCSNFQNQYKLINRENIIIIIIVIGLLPVNCNVISIVYHIMYKYCFMLHNYNKLKYVFYYYISRSTTYVFVLDVFKRHDLCSLQIPKSNKTLCVRMIGIVSCVADLIKFKNSNSKSSILNLFIGINNKMYRVHV